MKLLSVETQAELDCLHNINNSNTLYLRIDNKQRFIIKIKYWQHFRTKYYFQCIEIFKFFRPAVFEHKIQNISDNKRLSFCV